ncbi:MAG: hypothetical protein MZW92_51690 [Comamonadaceae bacterium]|nr:hypothetical protein [Comamonadaceae bacterium]
MRLHALVQDVESLLAALQRPAADRLPAAAMRRRRAAPRAASSATCRPASRSSPRAST